MSQAYFILRSMRALAVFVSITALSRPAFANGRFPQASQLVVDPENAANITVRTTYGAVLTRDGGQSWRWVCENSMGYTGVFDPAIATTTSGAVIAGLPDGLSRTTDACSWARASTPVDKEYVIDVAARIGEPSRVVAITYPKDVSTPGYQASFFLSVDGAKTWSGPELLPEDFKPQTIEVAPSRPERLYASGNGPFPLFGVIMKSDDGGKSWTDTTFDLRGARAPFVSAVHPTNPDIFYLRIDGEPNDRLSISRNGGSSIEDLYPATSELLGFALSPDGSKVAIGGPNEGLLIASTTDHSFKKVSSISVSCLTWTAAGLYACASEPKDGFSVGLSTDEGATFKPLYRGIDLKPLDCPKGTVGGDVCPGLWPAVEQSLRPPVDAGVVDAEAGTLPDGGNTAPPPREGCSCEAAAPAGWSGFAIGVSALLMWIRRRRR